MRSVVSYALIAIVGGMIGAAVIKSDDLYPRIAGHFSAEPADPDGFWSTPAVEGYGKIHYEADAAFKLAVGLSNKVVFQLTRNEGDIKRPNLGLERVARVVNLYIAAGVPADKLQFMVSIIPTSR